MGGHRLIIRILKQFEKNYKYNCKYNGLDLFECGVIKYVE